MVVVVMVRNESLLDFDSDVNDEWVKRSLSSRSRQAGRAGAGRHSSFRMVGRKKMIRKKATGSGRATLMITCMGCLLGSPRGGRGVEWS